MKSPRIVRNMVLRIDHDAYGEFGLVTRANQQRVDVVTEKGVELNYEPEAALEFSVVGSLRRGKAYGVLNGRRFQRVELHPIDARPPRPYDIVTRGSAGEPEETRAAVIYRMALQRMAEEYRL